MAVKKLKNTPNPEQEEFENAATRTINIQSNKLQLQKEKAKVKNAVLIIIRGKPQGEKYILTDSLVLGRDKSADICIPDNSISREHARIQKASDGYTLEDLGSYNGTFLNDKKLTRISPLQKEDIITIGSTILKYIPAGELEILYQDNLTNAAYIDSLTQVYNRNYITQVLEAEFKRAKALHSDFPILLFDIDHFKRINDSLGHDAGDFVLRQLTKLIKDSGLRERDLLGRWGGEEFLLLSMNSTEDAALSMGERIRKNIENHSFDYNGEKIQVSISIGISNLKPSHNSYMDLYKEADRALYSSKENGRNLTTVFKTKNP